MRARATTRIRRAPDANRAEAYRLSLEGFRKLERSDVASAQALLARSLTLDPNDPVARYRYGRALLSSKNDAAALEQFERAIEGAHECPAPIAAAAYLEAARVHERLAHRDEAIAYYRIASTWFGGGSDTRAAANRALNRLRAPR